LFPVEFSTSMEIAYQMGIVAKREPQKVKKPFRLCDVDSVRKVKDV